MGFAKQRAVTRSVIKTCLNRAIAEIDSQTQRRYSKIKRPNRYLGRMDRNDLQAVMSLAPRSKHQFIRTSFSAWNSCVSAYCSRRSAIDAQHTKIHEASDKAKEATRDFLNNVYNEINLAMSVEELQKLRKFSGSDKWISQLSRLGFDAFKIISTFPEWVIVQIPLRRMPDVKAKAC